MKPAIAQVKTVVLKRVGTPNKKGSYDFILTEIKEKDVEILMNAIRKKKLPDGVTYPFPFNQVQAMGTTSEFEMSVNTFIDSWYEGYDWFNDRKKSKFYPCYACGDINKKEAWEQIEIKRLHSTAESSMKCALNMLGNPEYAVIYKMPHTESYPVVPIVSAIPESGESITTKMVQDTFNYLEKERERYEKELAEEERKAQERYNRFSTYANYLELHKTETKDSHEIYFIDQSTYQEPLLSTNQNVSENGNNNTEVHPQNPTLGEAESDTLRVGRTHNQGEAQEAGREVHQESGEGEDAVRSSETGRPEGTV